MIKRKKTTFENKAISDISISKILLTFACQWAFKIISIIPNITLWIVTNDLELWDVALFIELINLVVPMII